MPCIPKKMSREEQRFEVKIFKLLADKIVKFILKSSPVQATHVGCHLYDRKMDNVDPDHIQERPGIHREALLF